MKSNRLPHPVVAAQLLAMLFVATTITSGAQAVDTAERRVRLNAFGMLSYVNPDYGGAKKNAGGTIGGDINVKSFGGRWEPGLEMRVLGSGGRVSNQYNYAFGPRIQYDWNRLHPYAEFLMGYGQLRFNNPIIGPDGKPYEKDNALTYNFGGGMEYSLTDRWAIRGDILQQRWKISPSAGTIQPLAVSVGVRYQFMFKSAAYPTAH